MPAVKIKRRVVHFGGFYASAPEAKFGHFRRQLARLSRAWSVTVDARFDTADADCARWSVIAEGPGWRAETEVIQFCWDDLIREQRARSWLTRLPLGLLSFADFVRHGALSAYFRLSWRYAAFFLYPFVLIALFALASIMLAPGLLEISGIAGQRPWRWALAALLFCATLPTLGRLLSLDYILDNWIFACREVAAPNPVIEARLDRLAALAADDPGVELLIAGHSFGPVYAVDLLARLIAARPDGPSIRFATLGSSILKLAVHEGARRLRDTVQRVAASPRVHWVDFTSRSDFMNFYKVEPVAALGLPGQPAKRQFVRFDAMLGARDFRRMQIDRLSMHNQFIMAGDRRAPYDFAMLTSGPFSLEALAASPEGALLLLDAAGGLTDAGRQAVGGAPPRSA